MKEEVIAVIRRKDGFVKEMELGEISLTIILPDIPIANGYINDTGVVASQPHIVSRYFRAKKKKIIIEYEEI